MDIDKLRQHFPLIIPACIAVTSLYFMNKSRPKENGYKEIPYPNSIQFPIFGHMLSLGPVPSKQTTLWHKEVGPIYKINMGNQTWIMISDPFLAHDIFVKSGMSTSSRPYHRFLTEMYGLNDKGIVFQTYGSGWKENRKTISSVMNPKSIDKFSKVLETEADSLMDRFGKYADDGTFLDPFNELQLTSMNIILTVLAAIRFKDTSDPTFIAINKYLYRAMIYGGATGDLSSFIPVPSWWDSLKGTDKILRDLIENERTPIYGKIIKYAQESEKDSLIKDMTQIMSQNGPLDHDDLLVITSDLIGAGSDTTAVSLYWALAILSGKPDVQQKIIDELDYWQSNNPGRAPNFQQDREALPYNICVQKEIMRFRPVTPYGIPHMASEDVAVNGYFIPKNSILISSMLAMHTNSDFYDHPEEFRPERFLNNRVKMGAAANTKIENRDFFVFGWGRRICPGIHLAEVEIFNFFVHFFAKFTVAPELDSHGNPVPINLDDYLDEGIIMKPVNYKIRIMRRV